MNQNTNHICVHSISHFPTVILNKWEFNRDNLFWGFKKNLGLFSFSKFSVVFYIK